MRILTSIFVSIALLSFGFVSNAQILDPIKWKFSVEQNSPDEATFIAKATIEAGWHMYATNFSLPDDVIGPSYTVFTFEASDKFEKKGGVTQGKYIVQFDKAFEMDLQYFENSATFKQIFKLKSAEKFQIKGTVDFMACNDQTCIPPDLRSFAVTINPNAQTTSAVESKDTTSTAVDTTSHTQVLPEGVDPFKLQSVDIANPINDCGQEKESQSLWAIFLFGLIGGLLALVTPCVFPMIPLTVTFFTKGAEAGKGKSRALTYGAFIVMVYFLVSLPFHLSKNVDPEILNSIATNVWLNLSFFVIFLFFAISFFGFFEITLPSGLANKVDSASNLSGGIGIFFMALTLVIVSFSCTGPILGSVIGSIYASDASGVLNFLGLELSLPASKISVAMLGFGIALGAPFALFAAFPGMLKKLPKSGGWLEDFKVSLGFIEVALAIKFLSNADLVQQWGILKREIFFAAWILVALLWVLYLLGIFKFKKGQGSKKMSTVKWSFTIIIALFGLRLIPGVLAPSEFNKFNFLSGFPPPKSYSFYHYEEQFKIYKDLDEAMAVAKAENKPLFVDFTGWACVNCRKMEENVWPVESVERILANDYIMCSLYVDEKVELPADKQFVYTTIDGRTKNIRTVGNKWATLQTETFRNNAQPFYALLTPDGKLLTPTSAYNDKADKYAEWLSCGLNAFEQSKNQQVSAN